MSASLPATVLDLTLYILDEGSVLRVAMTPFEAKNSDETWAMQRKLQKRCQCEVLIHSLEI
ncbi:hypothetical protein [Agrobacterium sp. Azo12]|uniref:hypothetical protein n=1 Tax=Agrobacterium sp. Azo12 TaxID=3031129 RepID=UPI0023D81BB9|nr:hypothetical protein [Agrobacterium sp. Azo12]MDO5897265.1 hypothetical protein [Agrobacterium sp. Azo12]